MFAVRHTAEPEHSRALRAGIDQWLTGLEWPEDDRDDVVLAVSEAFENAAAHAYPPGTSGVVDVFGRVQAVGSMRRVILRVADRGRWRPPLPDPGYRGRGLGVMRECMGQTRIDYTPVGTTVKLTSSSVPLLDAATASPAHPPMRRSQPSIVPVPAGDDTSGERRPRREEIMLATGRLRVAAQSLSAAAAAAWLRTQHTIRASSRLCTDAQRIRNHCDVADPAA